MEDYNCVGIRYQDKPAKVGSKINHRSHSWDCGTDTGEKLRGVSAINVDAIDQGVKVYKYSGDYKLTLGSYESDYGEDPGEIIMIDAVVLKCERV